MKLGIDIGGTFTDFVLYDERNEEVRLAKTLTTYPDPTNGIFNGINELKSKFGLALGDLDKIVHGTTLVTNAVIERKGARTAFITTKGFEDVLEIQRELRYDIYDLNLTMPKPLVPRNLRYGVEERVDTHGNILTILNESDLAKISQEITHQKIESLGVCLLNSFANIKHEQQVKKYFQSRHPQLSISLSSELMPEIREYERSSATAMNAFIQPLTDQYLHKLEEGLQEGGFVGNLLIMISNGRLTSLRGAIDSPIHLLESGPAGGTMAAVFFGDILSDKNLLSFDMGGTTAKASLINGGRPEITNQFEAGRVKRFRKGSGLPVRIPVIDMIEIGAGGGSIARVSELGLLSVGPDSASSNPGPACYGLGGKEPTVTDADLILGYLDANYFLGGTMDLDLEHARKVMKERIADPLKISVEEAAMGIHRIVNQNMANAARVHILEKGMDPRHFNMIAFGGAGPVHAFGVAKLINSPKLYIPFAAGVTSALGFLVSPIASEKIHSHISLLEDLDWKEVNQFLESMETEGEDFLRSSGLSQSEKVERIVDIRYHGQGHEISIHLPKGPLNEMSIEHIQASFEEEYVKRYHRKISGVPLEMVTWRVAVIGPKEGIEMGKHADKQETSAFKNNRKVYYEATGFMDTPVYDRYLLGANVKIDGPMIIEEKESTTVVGLNSTVHVDAFQNIIIEIN